VTANILLNFKMVALSIIILQRQIYDLKKSISELKYSVQKKEVWPPRSLLVNAEISGKQVKGIACSKAVKGALNPNFLNLTKNKEKFCL